MSKYKTKYHMSKASPCTYHVCENAAPMQDNLSGSYYRSSKVLRVQLHPYDSGSQLQQGHHFSTLPEENHQCHRSPTLHCMFYPRALHDLRGQLEPQYGLPPANRWTIGVMPKH